MSTESNIEPLQPPAPGSAGDELSQQLSADFAALRAQYQSEIDALKSQLAAQQPVPVKSPIELSPDPLLANTQVRQLIGQEIARLQQLAATPGNTPITLQQLLAGPLHS